MKIVRRKRNYYLHVVLRGALIVFVILAGILIGVFASKKRYVNNARENRVYVCVLNKDIEAGALINDAALEEVSLIKEESDFLPLSYEACIGKQAKIGMKKGTVLCDALICDVTDEVESMRKLSYSYIKNTDLLKQGDVIDVRISFPNGADFVLLSRKEVLRIAEDTNEVGKGVWLSVSEEEILRMSSGVVDAYLFDGAYIYATLYMNEVQEASIVNYPVNEVVEELIKKDPNIIEIAQNQKTLELRSRVYENASDEKEESKQSEEGLIYFE